MSVSKGCFFQYFHVFRGVCLVGMVVFGICCGVYFVLFGSVESFFFWSGIRCIW